MADRVWDTVVVGAGAAGLAAAEALSREGQSVAILEARARVGGRIWTRRVRGWPLPVELGPEFVHGRDEQFLALARSAGLLIDRLPDVHVEVQPSGWRLAHDIWRRFEGITNRMRSSGTDRSVADFLAAQRRLSGQDRRLAASIVEGYDAAPLNRASERVLSTAGQPASTPGEHAQFRVISGYGALVKWLWSRIDWKRCKAYPSSPVREIRWRRGRVEAATESSRFRARRAIISVPVGVLQAGSSERGSIRFDPEPGRTLRAARRLEMGQVVKIVLLFREAFWRESPEYERHLAKGSREPAFFHRREGAYPTWWTAAPAEVPMITGWAGGPAAYALRGLSEPVIVSRALKALELLFGTSAVKLRRLLLAPHMHDWNADPFARGAYSYVAVGGQSAPAALARPVKDTLFFAGEATSSDQSGTVPGAIATGRRAAEQILGRSGATR